MNSNNCDKVLIRGLTFECIVGILSDERLHPQSLSIDVDMETDFSQAAMTEDVVNTIDYSLVSELIAEHVQKGQYWLLETMAHEILDLLFERFDAIKRARVLIEKPQAVAITKWVGVESFRSR